MAKNKKHNELVPKEAIENRIFVIRGQKVMLSTHLAALYCVEPRILNQAVKRNIKRFPEDFLFQLDKKEAGWLVSQNVIPHKKYLGGFLPLAFTEQGIAMPSGVLNSDRAILVNINIMRAFVKIRQIISMNKDLFQKMKDLETKYEKHDNEIKTVFSILRRIMVEEEKPNKKIGFLVE